MLAYYYLRSSELVKDPLSTMLYDLIPVAISQCLFCAVCLPSVGNWNSGTDAQEVMKETSTAKGKLGSVVAGTPKKKVGGPGPKGTTKTAAASDPGGSWPSRVFPTIFSLFLAITIPPVPLMVLALILGAPLYPTSLLPHTLALALHVSLLSTLPIFYTHGVSAGAWSDVSAAWLPFDQAGVWGGTVGALVGGWFGAIPIALDWDREWQKWPCTVLWGVTIGWALGRVITSHIGLGVGRRIDLSVSDYTTPPQANSQAKEQKKLQ